MGKSMMIFGSADARAPSAATAEDAAFEYHVNRKMSGIFAPRPPVERWSGEQRKRFEKELERLEKENAKQTQDAVKLATRR